MHLRVLLVVVFTVSLSSYAGEHLFSGLGGYHRKISTNSKKAQKYFDQGLAFLFAFNHDEAIRSFREATKLDPKATMAWWGLANANGPHINNPTVDEAHAKAAWEAVQNGLARSNRETKLEHALMEATAKRFSEKAVEDRSPLDKAYAAAMREIWNANPKDADVGVLFAEAMMDLKPWDLYKNDDARTPQDGTEEILSTLRAILKRAPKHPQANHLYIHASEASANPDQAAKAADRLRNLQPALGHMVHMPSHIDVRTGRWSQAVVANERSIKADAAYRAIRPTQGFYRFYMLHNHHMLAYASMMSAQSKKAIEAVDTMVANVPKDWAKEMAPFVDGFMAMPFEVRIRFGKWEEVLAKEDFPEYFPMARALRRATRAIAFSALGKIDDAKKEQSAFLLAKSIIPKDAGFGNNTVAGVLAVEEHLMNGEILLAEKKMDEAIAELKEAVKAEDALRYSEPPDWIQPARHTLGAFLLSAGRYEEAREVYEADLKRVPENVWSLYGLSESLERLGKKQRAQKVRARYNKVRKENHSDVEITTSCLCIAHKSL
jgi:tetratricopeptide (TPR) repeat protein